MRRGGVGFGGAAVLALVFAAAGVPGPVAAAPVPMGPELPDAIATETPALPAPTAGPNHLRTLAVTLRHLAPGLDPRAIEHALDAAWSARERGVDIRSSLLTVIDYTKPSWQPRLWVFDIAMPRVLFTDRVAHGANTGEAWARHFSNRLGSRQTSLGLFLTGDPYVGDNGYSLRLHGLDRNLNANAFERAVVMHGAPYVSDEFVREHGRIGRSWGCPAVSTDLARPLIDTIRGGSLIYAYSDVMEER